MVSMFRRRSGFILLEKCRTCLQGRRYIKGSVNVHSKPLAAEWIGLKQQNNPLGETPTDFVSG